ncbi:hypothetical protein Syun_027274 [Stephania yunnanensis]|uniref:Uncharacterized protein n=1 Tax=Stephania yunnanensis TaxID=152371 RepID=A0AAP0EMM6_9MAGN
MSSCSSKICFNPDCKESSSSSSVSERPRKGWRIRSGELVELCGRCASAYEEGRFCKTFHLDSAGWRICESCGKPLHCGCIVSVHELVLRDSGGVECLACANKNVIMASNQIWPPASSIMSRTLPERLKDYPVTIVGHWWHPSNVQMTAAVNSELHWRMPQNVELLSSTPIGKNKQVGMPERVKSGNLELPALSRAANGNSGDNITASNTFKMDEVAPDGLQGLAYEVHSDSGVHISRELSSSKDDSSIPRLGSAVFYTSSADANLASRGSETLSQGQTPLQLVKQYHGNPHNGVESSSETQLRIGKQRADARGKTQLLPRYWPRITDQELQQISGNSNSVITPLFEKMLSASDAGRIGRLVLPKKCAEAYFPAISQSEGLPLKVQDAKGKEWVFQFRFWPNNNSRMYVLEGVTPCIQSMQLQAGDTVTFSRIDPEGKLVMGFRKASSNVQPSDQVNSTDPDDTLSKVGKSGYMTKEVHGAKSSLIPSKRKSNILGSKSKRLRIENEDSIELKLTWEQAQGLLRPPPNHIPSIMVIEGHEFEEYEEAPILGRPTILPANDFSEKIQWVQCEDCSKWRKLPLGSLLPSRWTCSDNSWDPKRSSCSSEEEMTTEQIENLLSSSNIDASKKKKSVVKDFVELEVSDGLDSPAEFAIMRDGKGGQPTTKHPRHRPGCTCIVCIQPPSGKGPKHRETCTCNVCSTVKRRFRTLMERRGKRQPEMDAEDSQKKHLELPEKLEQDNDPTTSSFNTSCNNLTPNAEANGPLDEDYGKKKQISPFKGQIDLNIQPEREDEPPALLDSGGMMKLLRDATNTCLIQKHLATSATSMDMDSAVEKLELNGCEGTIAENHHDMRSQDRDNVIVIDADCPVMISMSVSTSTSAAG